VSSGMPCIGHVHYKRGYKYQLTRDYAHQLRFKTGVSYQGEWFRLDDDFLLIYTGYAWDGASGPTADTPSTMRGSAVHDVGYQSIRLGVLPESFRALFDQELERCCQEDGMWPLRAKTWYRMLRWFGKRAATSPDKPERIAPTQAVCDTLTRTA
jgi:hypothetical protein